MTTPTAHGQLGELVRYFLRLGFLGFGGPVRWSARWSANS
jgi:chromate transporter